MEIQLADEHVYVLEDRLTPEEIRQRIATRCSTSAPTPSGSSSPGGSLAVKVAKLAMDQAEQRSNA